MRGLRCERGQRTFHATTSSAGHFSPQAYAGVWETARRIWVKEGQAAFFKGTQTQATCVSSHYSFSYFAFIACKYAGVGTTIARSIPVNMVTFLGFELVLQFGSSLENWGHAPRMDLGLLHGVGILIRKYLQRFSNITTLGKRVDFVIILLTVSLYCYLKWWEKPDNSDPIFKNFFVLHDTNTIISSWKNNDVHFDQFGSIRIGIPKNKKFNDIKLQKYSNHLKIRATDTITVSYVAYRWSQNIKTI